MKIFIAIRREKPFRFALWIFLGIALGLSSSAQAARVARGEKAMAATAHPLASKAAADVMREGGTAADAFVAAALVLSVVEPHSSGLGGGGFLLYRTPSGETFAFDFRERAPAAAHPDLYLRDGKPDGELSRTGALSVAVPGITAGLEEIHRRFGKLPRERLVRDALLAAREGFPVYPILQQRIRAQREVLERFEESAKIWLPKRRLPPVGGLIKQENLARSLELFSKDGAALFYKGEIGRAIAKVVQENGGILTEKDLAAYKVLETTPLRGTYRDWEVVSFPPPSSGGAVLIEMLNLLAINRPWEKMQKGCPELEQKITDSFYRFFLFPLNMSFIKLAWFSNNFRPQRDFCRASDFALRTPHLTDTMRLAYADRAEYLGDPRYSQIPTDTLISKEYAKRRFHDPKAPKADVEPGEIDESPDTTHLSIIGPEGDAVSATLTINLPFGSAMTVPGYGILLNDEMDDFAAAPGVPNAFGLVQGEKNKIEPGKTPLSSMTPTFVLKDGKLRYVMGTPGGSRIITTVFQLMLNVIDLDMTAEQAMDAPRVHHQWKPGTLFVEKGYTSFFDPTFLERQGYKVKVEEPWCNAQAVFVEKDGVLTGVSDERGFGRPEGF